ncbi:unnamed protein product [Urochloa decumbens]|uniref:Transposase n=1 Tax=Urochloa decumbens TaxID=240449 RepID=A0ABC9BL69_9POAL
MDRVDEHDGDDMQAETGLASDGNFRNEKSVAWDWDKCKPQLVNGVIWRPSSELWKDFIPLYADGRSRIMAAECVNCHVRLNANRSTLHLRRHIQTCPVHCILKNVEVQFSEYGSKFRKCSSGDRTPVDRHISSSPATKRMDPKKDQNTPSAHAVHDWKLQRRMIKFGVFESSTTNLDRMIHLKETHDLNSGSEPLDLIWEAIRDWDLDQKLFSLISVGDIRSNERVSKLKDFLNQRKCLPIGGALYNIACVDDVLNNIVSEDQPLLHLVGDILEKFIQAHMSSSPGQQQLIEVMTNMTLKCPQEDAKRWHKIYFGLEVLLHFKKAFPSEELLSAKNTRTVESVCNILRAFYHAFEALCGPFCPTANIYFNELWIIRTTLEEEASTDHSELATMVWKMQEAFDEYWQNSYVWLSAAAVLDPRFKFAFIEFRLKQAFGTDAAKYVSTVRETIWELFLEYCTAVDEPSVDRSNCDSGNVQVAGLYKDSLKDWDEHVNAQASGEVLTELDKYLDDGLLPRKDDFDVLNWWMSNSTKYPTLSIMARDILAIPASAVHCEAALSNEGLVVHKQWCTLNVKTIEALVCIRDWIK